MDSGAVLAEVVELAKKVSEKYPGPWQSCCSKKLNNWVAGRIDQVEGALGWPVICYGIPHKEVSDYFAALEPENIKAICKVAQAAIELRELLRGKNGTQIQAPARKMAKILEAFGAFDEAVAEMKRGDGHAE